MFKNDEKVKHSINIGEPLFKREVKKEKVRVGYDELISRLNETHKTLNKVKNGKSVLG
jgi:hypothetical protein